MNRLFLYFRGYEKYRFCFNISATNIPCFQTNQRSEQSVKAIRRSLIALFFQVRCYADSLIQVFQIFVPLMLFIVPASIIFFNLSFDGFMSFGEHLIWITKLYDGTQIAKKGEIQWFKRESTVRKSLTQQPFHQLCIRREQNRERSQKTYFHVKHLFTVSVNFSLREWA